MRRHLAWIAGAAALAALGILVLIALRPPVAQAPTATPRSGSPSAPVPGTVAPSTSPSRTSPSPAAPATPAPGAATAPPQGGPVPDGYRPPPDSFDPASIRWSGDAVTGSSQEKRFGLWTAAIDGSDLRQIALGEIGTLASLATPDGTVAFLRAGDTGMSALFLVRRETDPVAVLPWVSEIGVGADGVYALAVGRGRSQPVTFDAGVFHIPAGSSDATEVVPGTNETGCGLELFAERTRTGIAVNADYIATGVCSGAADGELHIDVHDRASGETRRLEIDARPLGFAPGGRLIAQSDEGFHAIDPVGGVSRPVDGDASGQARLTADGRYLVTYTGGNEVVTHDLASGAVRTWPLTTDVGLDLTALGTGSRVVLESYASFPDDRFEPGWHVVVDPAEGWLGWLPPIAPLRDDPPG